MDSTVDYLHQSPTVSQPWLDLGEMESPDRCPFRMIMSRQSLALLSKIVQDGDVHQSGVLVSDFCGSDPLDDLDHRLAVHVSGQSLLLELGPRHA